MTFGYIYKIEFPNGKIYIGQTSRTLEQRKKEHKYSANNIHNNKLLYKSLRKYDMVDNFELIEIDTADTEQELCEKEITYILTYNSYYIDGNGYNMTYGGEGSFGYKHSEETRFKMHEIQKNEI